MKDPQHIPDELIDRAARAMHGANAISKMEFALWEECQNPERAHWLKLAQVSLLSVAAHIDQWPELAKEGSGGLR